jgi:hypothetical protein
MNPTNDGPLGSFDLLFELIPASEMRDHPRIVGQILAHFCRLPNNAAALPVLLQGVALHLAPLLALCDACF